MLTGGVCWGDGASINNGRSKGYHKGLLHTYLTLIPGVCFS